MVRADQLRDKGALSLQEFMAWSSLGRTKALEEIASGQLPAVKVGRRLLIPVDGARRWLAGKPAVVRGEITALI